MKGQGRIGDDISSRQIEHSYHFSLKSSHPSTNHQFAVKVDFSLFDNHARVQKNLTAMPEQQKSRGFLLPKLWKGSQWRIKGFYQPGIEPQFQKKSNQAFERMKKLRLDPFLDEAIMCPEPASNFCHLCQEPFTIYLKHVQHQIHKKKMKTQTPHQSTQKIIQMHKQFTKDHLTRVERKVNDGLHLNSSKIRIVDQLNTVTPVRLSCSPSQKQPQKQFKIPFKNKTHSSKIL